MTRDILSVTSVSPRQATILEDVEDVVSTKEIPRRATLTRTAGTLVNIVSGRPLPRARDISEFAPFDIQF